MGKVYRLHEGAEGTGWFTSKIFNDEELDSILTDGKEVSNSIPSPFARIDLVNEAFRWVAQNNLDDNKAQHKLVSDALDIGQLIFYSGKFRNKIEILDYSPKQRISKNFGDVVRKHKELAKTFDVYWEQDAGVYNFNETDSIHFVLYNKEIIGATSPKSLFFSAPFKPGLRDEINIQRASGKYFGEKAVPLHRREWDFIEYLFTLSKQAIFAKYFPDLYEYLEKVKETLDTDQRRLINELNEDLLTKYPPCHVTGEAANYCKVVNMPLHTAKGRINDIEDQSDFAIKSDHPIEGKKPLVLPNRTFSEEWVFTTKDVKWNPNDYNGNIPDKNDSRINESRIPIHGDEYPWLSEGNFLTDKIIKLPYEIDSDKFVTGEGRNGNNYLLPLTETFFEYFDSESVSDMITIDELGQGTVIVKLNIKTRGGVVKFEKHYKESEKQKIELHLAILPFVKVEKHIPVKYIIGMIDGDIFNNHKNDVHLEAFSKGQRINLSTPVLRAPGNNKIKSAYLSADRCFDAIKINFNRDAEGFLIPRMREYNPTHDKCSFAVDFGTTNTHIEYNIGGNTEKAFNIDGTNTLWCSLLNKNSDPDHQFITNEEAFEEEIFPISIGDENSEVSFPLRTAMVENEISFKKPVEIFKHLNNYLLYEQRSESPHLNLNTSLKWGNLNIPKNRIRLRSYIENLAWLIYYKVLSLNIDPSGVRIVWLYPTSMSKHHRGQLESAWSEKVSEIFGKTFSRENLQSLPESVGPYMYYYKIHGITGLSVSIDIGGGSTDVSVYDQENTKLISSFRFAGDSIFGDGYGKSPKTNGFVQIAKNEAYSYLDNNKIDRGIIDQILNVRKKSNDFSSYLFSLSNKSGGAFDFSSIIRNDPNIKLVILLFHAGIAYYISKMINKAGFDNPKQILFSGSAAKTVSLIDTSSGLEEMSKLYKFIFEKINSSSTNSRMNCNLSPIPKEITCKGGLLSGGLNLGDYEKTYWLGGKNNLDKNADLTNYSTLLRYDDIEGDELANVTSAIQELYELLDQFSNIINIEETFGISRKGYELFQETRSIELEGDLKRGIAQTKSEQEYKGNEPIEESLFFYPLVGEISRLGYELSKLSQN